MRKPISTPPSPLEPPAIWRLVLRRLRSLLMVAVAIIVLVDTIGEPLLRVEYRYRGQRSDPIILSATYYGLSGRHEQPWGECPLVLWKAPKPPLWQRLASYVSRDSV